MGLTSGLPRSGAERSWLCAKAASVGPEPGIPGSGATRVDAMPGDVGAEASRLGVHRVVAS